MKKMLRRGAALVLCVCVTAAGMLARQAAALPDTFYGEGAELSVAAYPWLTPLESRRQPVELTARGSSRNVTLSLFGKVPVKTVRMVQSQRRRLVVLGTPFGMKMFSDGAMVVGFTDVETGRGLCNPAQEAGLKLGDLMVSLNGQTELNNEAVAQAVAESAGQPLRIVYRRDGETASAVVTPVFDADSESWRAGMWVRDSSAGVGTMTFADPIQGTYGGLGHAISDADTGESITLRTGEVVPVDIVGLVRGTQGDPGELRGVFSSEPAIGSILVNDVTGVYGCITGTLPQGQEMEVAFIQEVEPGPAQILTTVEGRTPQTYEVVIEKVTLNGKDENRNLILRVTDEVLLEKTGGIIQGMSGSPILQNGKLVGAVTHVLVNDPARGYGIFIENMLDAAA